jgi:hypothetical protein
MNKPIYEQHLVPHPPQEKHYGARRKKKVNQEKKSTRREADLIYHGKLSDLEKAPANREQPSDPITSSLPHMAAASSHKSVEDGRDWWLLYPRCRRRPPSAVSGVANSRHWLLLLPWVEGGRVDGESGRQERIRRTENREDVPSPLRCP